MDIYNTLHLDSNRNPFMLMASTEETIESRVMVMSLLCCDLLKKNKKILVLLTRYSPDKFKNLLYSNLQNEFFNYEKKVILKDISGKYSFSEIELYIKYFFDIGEKFDYIIFDDVLGSKNYLENNYGQLILETQRFFATHELVKDFNNLANNNDFFCYSFKEICIEYDVNIIIGCQGGKTSKHSLPNLIFERTPTSVLWIFSETISNQFDQNEQFYKLKLEYSKHPSQDVVLMPKTLYMDKISGFLMEDTSIFYNKIFVKS